MMNDICDVYHFNCVTTPGRNVNLPQIPKPTAIFQNPAPGTRSISTNRVQSAKPEITHKSDLILKIRFNSQNC